MADEQMHSAPVSSSVSIEVEGETLVLRGDRTMYWPRQRWLIAADVHLGKAESLRRDGVALPDAVMDADLARLQTAVRESGAERLVILGDLVHDAVGLTSALIDRVSMWRRGCDAEIALIPGNHDRRVAELPHEWNLMTLAERVVASPFVLTHEPLHESGFTWCGHVHPAITLRGRGDRWRAPCFIVGPRRGILPAFSTLTGGATQRLAAHERAWVIVEHAVIALPRVAADDVE